MIDHVRLVLGCSKNLILEYYSGNGLYKAIEQKSLTFNDNLDWMPHFWNIQRKFRIIQRNFFGNRIFHFLALKQFWRISKMVVCIPEVLTILLTPILTYLWVLYVRCHVCHTCQICHLWHFWHVWCSDIHRMYVNMGVKRSIGTPEMQLANLNIFYT